MKLTEEDGAITALAARCRSDHGVEDSIGREDFRTVMAYVKRSSGYGYRETHIISQHRPITPEALVEIEKLGFTFRDWTMPHWNKELAANGKIIHNWIISWP